MKELLNMEISVSRMDFCCKRMWNHCLLGKKKSHSQCAFKNDGLCCNKDMQNITIYNKINKIQCHLDIKLDYLCQCNTTWDKCEYSSKTSFYSNECEYEIRNICLNHRYKNIKLNEFLKEYLINQGYPL
jgi:hypothetical protein